MTKLIDRINTAETLEDLELLDIGPLDYEISYRGGHLCWDGDDVARKFKVDPNLLPGHFGAGCNYLGGGVRGAIFGSTFSKEIPENKAVLLNALLIACIRVYEYLENGLNDEECDDGETNWDAKATNAARRAGVVSYPGLG